MDGVTGAVQDRIRHYYHTEKWNMMFYMNLISSVFLGAGALVTGEFVSFIAFIQTYPNVLTLMLVFAACGAAGQVISYSWALNDNVFLCFGVTAFTLLLFFYF